MPNRKTKQARPPVDPVDKARDESGSQAAKNILSPALPRGGAGMMLEADPRLNRQSESEAALDELLQANTDAAREKRSEKKRK